MNTRGMTTAYLRTDSFLKLTRVMKLTCTMLLLCCLHVFAKGHTQDRITLNLESADLKKVLTEIQKKTDYRFLYNQSLMQNKGKVDVHVINEKVTSVLNSIFEGSGIG